MPTSERKSAAAEAAERQPPASDAPAGTEAGQAGQSQSGANTQGSPAAPAMKQFAKTEAESRGRG